jgi:hypothetical protein
MDAANSLQHGYERPSVTDYGTLADMTADIGMFVFGVAGLSGPLVPDNPGGPDTPGGPGGPTPEGSSLQVPETVSEGGLGAAAPEVEGGEGESAPAGTEAEGGGGSGGGGGGPVAAGGGGGGSLPFTGLAAGGVAAVGAALTGAGAALRRVARRRRAGRM